MNSAAPLTGAEILVVEDEAIVAMMLEDILIEAGASVVGPAMTIEKAHADAAREGLTAAVLDVNIGGHPIYPVASVLAGRGIPIVFVTGYGVEGLEPEWRVHTTIQKPYMPSEVVSAILMAIDRKVSAVPG